MRAFSIKVSGRVQGVFFRASTQAKAVELGICGWCRNEADGSVLIHAEGDEVSISDFITWCRQGPRMANVDQLIKNEVAVEAYSDFQIKRV